MLCVGPFATAGMQTISAYTAFILRMYLKLAATPTCLVMHFSPQVDLPSLAAFSALTNSIA